MNNGKLIKQYLTLAVIVLIAIFILSQLEWATNSIREPAGSAQLSAPETKLTKGPSMNSRDLRGGGITPATRSQPTPGKVNVGTFPTPDSTTVEAATSTPFQAATSTPFQAGSRKTGQFAGVEIEYGPLKKTQVSTKATAEPVSEETVTKSTNAHPTLNTGLNISGSVLDDKGGPVVNLQLRLQLRQSADSLKRSFGKAELTALTDEKGRYEFLNLVKGEYRVCTLKAQGYKSVCQNLYAPHTSADFLLLGMVGGSVYGSVIDQDGAPLAEVSVSASPGQGQRTSSDEKGSYELPMTINGKLNYQLNFSKKGYFQQRVAVKGSAVLNGKRLDIRMAKQDLIGFDVSGRLYDQTGAPVSGRLVKLLSPTLKSPQPLQATSDANGEFTIRFVQTGDDYRLSINTGGAYTFDASSYKKMKLFEGMPPMQLQLRSSGQGSFAARVTTTVGEPVTGETFALYAGSSFIGRAVSDRGGQIRFDDVPVMAGGSSLRVSGGTSPRYTFSGMTLREGEHMSDIELLVDRGYNTLELIVLAENRQPLAGAQGVLIWSRTKNGIRNQTKRSRGKISMAESGLITFSELGIGEHTLQVRLEGYLPFSTRIDISQSIEREEVVLTRAAKAES